MRRVASDGLAARLVATFGLAATTALPLDGAASTTGSGRSPRSSARARSSVSCDRFGRLLFFFAMNPFSLHVNVRSRVLQRRVYDDTSVVNPVRITRDQRQPPFVPVRVHYLGLFRPDV